MQLGDFVVAVIAFAFFHRRSRACKRAIAPLGQLGDRDIRLSSMTSAVAPPTSPNEQVARNDAGTAEARSMRLEFAGSHELNRLSWRFGVKKFFDLLLFLRLERTCEVYC